MAKRKEKSWPEVSCREPLPKPPPVVIPPVNVGQTVYLSVIVKNIFGESNDCSPKVFATEEAAQADCDELNKGRMGAPFIVRKQVVS